MIPTSTDISISSVTDPRHAWDKLMHDVSARRFDAVSPTIRNTLEEVLTTAMNASVKPPALAYLEVMTVYLRAYWLRSVTDDWEQDWPLKEAAWLTQMDTLQQAMSEDEISDMEEREIIFEAACGMDRIYRDGHTRGRTLRGHR